MIRKYFLLLAIILLSGSIALSQTVVPKQVGIGFRWDDNASVLRYSSYFAVFNKYGVKAGLGLNFGTDPMTTTPSYIDSLRKFQQQGHELMDHTPNHRTNFFRTTFSVFDYDGLPGVDHRVGNKICLEFATPIISNARGSGYCNINGNQVSIVSAQFAAYFRPGSTDANTGYYIYIPSLPASAPNLFLMDMRINDTTVVRVTDVWNDPVVNLGTHTNVQYYLFSAAGVRLTIDGIRVLANETLKLADYYGLQRPTTWIQPGMAFLANSVTTENLIFPTLNRADLKAALTPLGYSAGATYTHSFQQEAVCTFNEYDPNQDAQFGIQWNILRDEVYNLAQMKSIIAHFVGINKALLGGGHGNPSSDVHGGESSEEVWQNYLIKMDSLLSWCQQKNIPVKTYKEWADILYNNVYNNLSLPDPYQNVFPKMNQDFDGNNYPDGYDLNGQYSTAYSSWIINDGPPGSDGFSFSSENGRIDIMADNTKFGAVEKGENYFEIWTKGSTGSSDIIVAVSFFADDGGWSPIEGPELRFSCNTPYWKRYRLENSVEDQSLIIPNNTKTVVFTVRSVIEGNEVRVGGIKLYKKGPSLNLTAALEGAYNSTTNDMGRYLSQLNYVPAYQPYASSPWNFIGDTLVTNTQVITQISGAAGYAVDWVLVELRDKNNPLNIVSRKAGIIRQNGSIIDPAGSPLTFEVPTDLYYITVRHRNHLMIRSTNPVSLTAGQTTSYNFTTAGNSVGGKLLDSSPVVWGMIAGDVDGNGQIQNSDNEDFIDSELGQTGYRNADIDMDGDVDANDNTVWQSNNGLGIQ